MSGARNPVLLALIVRLSYIAVLKAAMNKAVYGEMSLNLETAINDLLAHLEAVKKIATTPPGAPGGGSGAGELVTLRDTIRSHEEMFRVLSAIMRRYDDVARTAASNRR